MSRAKSPFIGLFAGVLLAIAALMARVQADGPAPRRAPSAGGHLAPLSDEASFAPQPAGWVTIVSEDFENGFPSGKWVQLGNPTWDDDDYKPHWGQRSAWCARGGSQGLDPAHNDYPNNASAWITYGPFDLSDASAAEVAFYLWMETELDLDKFWLLVSTDNQNWQGWWGSGSYDGEWRRFQADLADVPHLGDVTGDASVWIAIAFESDGSVTAQGAFIDDITLRKQVAAAPSPTPTRTQPAGDCIIASQHPYADYQALEWTVTNPNGGATCTRVHFARIELGSGDKIIIRNADTGSGVQEIYGPYVATDVWSNCVPGTRVKVELWTDGADNRWGFCVDQVGGAVAPPSATPTRTQALTGTPMRTKTPTRTLTPTSTFTRTSTQTRTATRTPTRTHTPTRTQTPTPTPTLPSLNLVADRLEITQGIQDLNNGVRLVADRRTFVRFHVHSTGGTQRASAVLRVQSGPHFVDLAPINPGGDILVRPSPDRAIRDHAFLFEVPTAFLRGTVSVSALLNPSRNPPETSYADNAPTPVTRAFEVVHPLDLVIYRFGYQVGTAVHWPLQTHVDHLIDWLWRAYPIPSINFIVRDRWYGDATVDAKGNLPQAMRTGINAMLESQKTRDWNDSYWVWYLGAHYYGMVDDGGGFLRGLAAGIPSEVATGPAGVPGTGSWDSDGSYGDWYGGHELAHTFGRHHAEFCGANAKDENGQYPPDYVAYPHPNGRISPTLGGNSAIYGFDIRTWEIYPPTWMDVMTYCSNEWISEFTYEGLMDYMQWKWTPQSLARRRSVDRRDRLLVTGALDPASGETDLQPLFVIPDAGDLQPRVDGDYAIVLRGPTGAELARFAFTPDMAVGGPAPADSHQEGAQPLLISELVPFTPGAVQVDIEGPGGTLLVSRQVGASPPSVTLLSPNGGEVLDSDPVTVSWTANDPDGDPLTFNVEYSPDNGQGWEMVAQNVRAQSVQVPETNLRGANQARFRVWVSDGLNTASDMSDGTCLVPGRPPTVKILAPAHGALVASGQTLSLRAVAYDADAGSLSGDSLTWDSDIDGFLGNGAQLAVTDLAVGVHTISVWADDGEGSTASDSVRVVVLAGISDLPRGGPALPLILRGAAPKMPAAPQRVLWDEAHDEGKTLSWARAKIIEPEHPDWVYCSRLAQDLADEFTLVRNASAPLTWELLRGHAAVVLPSLQEGLSEQEREAVRRYLLAGGGVLWLGGVEWMADEFLVDMGIDYDGRVLFEIAGDGDFSVTDLADHPAVQGVSGMVTNWGGSIDVGAPAIRLTTTSQEVFRDLDDDYAYDPGEPRGPFDIAAAYEAGPTRLIFLAGAPFQNHGYDDRDNTPLVRAFLRWLTSPRP